MAAGWTVHVELRATAGPDDRTPVRWPRRAGFPQGSHRGPTTRCRRPNSARRRAARLNPGRPTRPRECRSAASRRLREPYTARMTVRRYIGVLAAVAAALAVAAVPAGAAVFFDVSSSAIGRVELTGK